MSDKIEESASLWDNVNLRNKVLEVAIPKTLQAAVALEVIKSRLPLAYAKALFASNLASRFIYTYGLNTPEFAFFEFVQANIGTGAV